MKTYRLIYFIISLLCLNFAFGLSNVIIFDTFWVDGWSYPSLFIVIQLTFILSFYITSQYKISPSKTLFKIVYDNIELCLLLFFLILVYWFSIKSDKYYRIGLVLFYSLFFLIKIVVDRIFVEFLRKSHIPNFDKNTLVIGDENFYNDVEFNAKDNAYIGVNLLEDKLKDIDEIKIQYIFNTNAVRNLFIHLDNVSLDDESENRLRKLCENKLVKAYVYSDILSSNIKRESQNLFGSMPFVPLFGYPLDNNGFRLLKRVFDIFFSLAIILFIFSWLFPIIAFLIKIQSPGPVLYIHDRIGLNNVPFKCLKFRTMYTRKKDEPFQQTVKGDPRIFPIGRFLRKTNIDEFPQFFNSLMGDISIVGPRPMILGHMLEYDHEIEEMYSRHLVKPGITGLAQVTGYRGEIDGVKKMRGRIRMDRYYLHNWSFVLDLKIIWWTIRNSIVGDENAI